MDTFSFGAPFLFIPRSQVFKHRIIIRYIVHINLCQAVYYRALRAAGCRARAWQPRDPRRLCELAVACTGCRAPAREPHLQDRGRRKRAAAFAREPGAGGYTMSSAFVAPPSRRRRVTASACARPLAATSVSAGASAGRCSGTRSSAAGRLMSAAADPRRGTCRTGRACGTRACPRVLAARRTCPRRATARAATARGARPRR
jgi:hypothetical protein